MSIGTARSAFLLVGVLLSGLGCGGIRPDAPTLSDKPPQQNELPDSRVDLLVHVSVDLVKQEIEKAVPASFGVADFNESINGGADHCCDGHSGAGGVSAGWAVSRDAFTLSATGNTLHLETDILYDLSGRSRIPCCGALCPSPCIGPLIYGSCGRNGEPRRKAHLGLNSAVELRPDWTFASQSSVTAYPVDRCTVTFANKDITDTIIDAARRFVERQGGAVDTFIASLPVKDKMTDVWKLLQNPREIRPGLWIEPRLTAAAVQQIGQIGTDLVAGVSLRASPRAVVSAAAPPQAQPSPPLPPLSKGAVGDAFAVAMPVVLPYSEATGQIRTALRIGDGGFRYPASGEPHIVIDDIDIYGAGSTVVARVAFHGSARGRLYFVGVPEYNPATNSISLAELDYSVETKNILLNAADWLLHGKLREELADRAHFNIQNGIKTAKDQLNKALSFQEGQLHIAGSLEDLRVLSVSADSAGQSLQANVLFSGTLSGEIR